MDVDGVLTDGTVWLDETGRGDRSGSRSRTSWASRSAGGPACCSRSSRARAAGRSTRSPRSSASRRSTPAARTRRARSATSRRATTSSLDEVCFIGDDVNDVASDGDLRARGRARQRACQLGVARSAIDRRRSRPAAAGRPRGHRPTLLRDGASARTAMRLADYVMQRVAEAGVGHVFMVPGGGAMHLNDALGLREDIEFVCHAARAGRGDRRRGLRARHEQPGRRARDDRAGRDECHHRASPARGWSRRRASSSPGR